MHEHRRHRPGERRGPTWVEAQAEECFVDNGREHGVPLAYHDAVCDVSQLMRTHALVRLLTMSPIELGLTASWAYDARGVRPAKHERGVWKEAGGAGRGDRA